MRLLAIGAFTIACAAYRAGRRLLVVEEEQLRNAADLAAAGGTDFGPGIDIVDDIEWWLSLQQVNDGAARVLGGLGA